MSQRLQAREWAVKSHIVVQVFGWSVGLADEHEKGLSCQSQ